MRLLESPSRELVADHKPVEVVTADAVEETEEEVRDLELPELVRPVKLSSLLIKSREIDSRGRQEMLIPWTGSRGLAEELESQTRRKEALEEAIGVANLIVHTKEVKSKKVFPKLMHQRRSALQRLKLRRLRKLKKRRSLKPLLRKLSSASVLMISSREEKLERKSKPEKLRDSRMSMLPRVMISNWRNSQLLTKRRMPRLEELQVTSFLVSLVEMTMMKELEVEEEVVEVAEVAAVAIETARLRRAREEMLRKL